MKLTWKGNEYSCKGKEKKEMGTERKQKRIVEEQVV